MQQLSKQQTSMDRNVKNINADTASNQSWLEIYMDNPNNSMVQQKWYKRRYPVHERAFNILSYVYKDQISAENKSLSVLIRLKCEVHHILLQQHIYPQRVKPEPI